MSEEGRNFDVKNKPEKGKTKVWLIILITVLAILILAGLAWAVYHFVNKSQKSEESTTTSQTSTNDKVVDEGVTWITPEKLDDLGLLEKREDASDIYTAYFKVGSTATGGDIIVSEVVPEGPYPYPYIHRFLKEGDKYYFLSNNNDPIASDSEYELTTKVESNSNTVFKSLLPDKVISKGTTQLTESTNIGIASTSTGFDEMSEIMKNRVNNKSQKVDTTKWGDLYWFDEGSLTGLEGKDFNIGYYYILLNDSTWQTYEVSPTFLRDDGTMNLNWTDQKEETIKYSKAATNGCGLGEGTVPILVTKNDLNDTHLVASKNNDRLYGPKTEDDIIFKVGYEDYKIGREESEIKSGSDFINDIGMVVWQDAYGMPIMFQNIDYQPQAECAKPVVYLYPTQTTNVTVKIGAKITQSEPQYKNGWRVTATPGGLLTADDGQKFDSLFWDGLGFGQYPTITSGKIVKTNDVQLTITNDLSYMGFNQKEIGDFLEYWMPKMPSTPYVRLTWLQNKEMDELAPLYIKPKPDTVIRAFLDFRGLNKPTSIENQTLNKYERKGYVATEWGGLLLK